MTIYRSVWRIAAGLSVLVGSFSAPADSVQLVTRSQSSLTPPASAGGDSSSAIATPDGRYVLFASTANNIVSINSNGIPLQLPPVMNVYRRDRVAGTTALVSVNLSGIGGNGDSVPTGISSDGRYALFESLASDLVVGDANGVADVFVRDLVGGTTSLVSVNTNGISATGASRDSVITPDGRYVAFVSAAANLAVGDANGIADIFIRDLQSNTTTNITAQSKSTGTSVGNSEMPAITPDGRYVAFLSTATNVVSGIKTPGEVFLFDRTTGTTIQASVGARAIYQSVVGNSNAISYNVSISADGRYIAFETFATNSSFVSFSPGVVLRYNVSGGTTDVISTNANVTLSSPGETPAVPVSLDNVHTLDMSPDGRFIAFIANTASPSLTNSTAIYLWDAQTGTNTLVSADQTSGLPANGVCDLPTVSSNGQYVAFMSNGANLTADPITSGFHMYVRNVQIGTTTLVDVNTAGSGSGLNATTVPGLSPDGQSIVFENPQDDWTVNDRNRAADVFRRDLVAGTNELISVHDPILPSVTPNGFNTLFSTGVSTNGRYTAFASEADNLVANDTNGCRDVFVRDQSLQTNILVSADTNGLTGAGTSYEPSISGDGRYVAFSSTAGNLSALDNNIYEDVFVRDLQAGTTMLISVNTNGTGSGDYDSFSPTISSDGRFVLFHSKADNLAAGSYGNPTENLLLRDLQNGTNYELAVGSSVLARLPASMTPDGHAIALIGSPPGMGFGIYVWNSQTASYVFTNTVSTASAVSISPDGQHLAYLTGSDPSLWAVDLSSGSNVFVSSVTVDIAAPMRFSDDSRFLVYSTTAINAGNEANLLRDIYLYDFVSGTNLLVSRSFNSSFTPNGPSDWPNISPDGHFVAYRSYASNTVPGDLNGTPDLFLFDRLSGGTALVTLNGAGNGTANHGSLQPLFSADGQSLVFQSWASDLVGNDFNSAGDIFSLNLGAWPIITGSASSGSTNSGSVFYAQFIPPGVLSPNPAITWPLAAGKTYGVLFKDNLTDPLWQNLNGDVTFINGVGYITDLAPAPVQRFYRVLLNN